MNQKVFLSVVLAIALVVVVAAAAENPSKVPSIAITASLTEQKVKRGDSIAISWQSTNAPAGSAVYLQLIPPEGKYDSENIIADHLIKDGLHEWHVPPKASSDIARIGGDYKLHGSDIVNGRIYQIRASLYIPTSAQCFEACSPTMGTQLAHSDSAAFTIEQP